MKSHYTLKGLNAQNLPIHSSEADTFFAMHDYLDDLAPSASLGTEDMLDQFLSEGMYYVAHNYVVHKGRKAIFKGRIVVASKENLLTFIKDAIANDDLRPLLVAPLFDGTPRQVTSLSEEGYFIYQQ